jgi:hypothetical protein
MHSQKDQQPSWFKQNGWILVTVLICSLLLFLAISLGAGMLQEKASITTPSGSAPAVEVNGWNGRGISLIFRDYHGVIGVSSDTLGLVSSIQWIDQSEERTCKTRMPAEVFYQNRDPRQERFYKMIGGTCKLDAQFQVALPQDKQHIISISTEGGEGKPAKVFTVIIPPQ